MNRYDYLFILFLVKWFHLYRLISLMGVFFFLFSACQKGHQSEQNQSKVATSESYYSMAEQFEKRNQYDSALLYYHKVINISGALKSKNIRGQGFSGIADIYNTLGKCDSAKHYAMLAVENLNKQGLHNDAYFLAATIQLHCYLLMGDYSSIIQAGLIYLDQAKGANDTGNIVRVSNALSEAYFAISHFERAIELRQKAVDLLMNARDKSLLKDIYTQLAVAYNENEQYDSAVQACYHSLRCSNRELSDDAYTYDFLADAYLGLRKNDSALRYLALSKQATEQIGDPVNLLNVLSTYTVYYNSNKQYQNAISTIDSALFISNKNGIVALLPAFWKMRAEAFEGMKDYRNALYAERIADSLNNHNSGEVTQQQMVELDKKYQAAQRESKIRHLTRESMLNRRLVQSVAVALAITVLFLGISIWQFYRQRKAKKVISRQAEKVQFLMKEIHHRVKNNLQVVSSLINLQLRSVQDPIVHDILVDTQTRIQSIGLIHQRLYQTEEIEQVNLQLYLAQLLETLKVVYQSSERKAKFLLSIPELLLDLDTAIPLALVLTELVSNSFKHAKIESGNPIEISISIHKINDAYQLDYGDNGKPITQKKSENETSVGLTIVKLMTKQMSGKFVHLDPTRAIYQLSFKLKEQRKRKE
ncbi:MAG: hypothetical protein JSS64_09380 [Bacteroidetes bacterium]|nr:hypothetical protein [Bacteroidota bacterium]